MGFRFPLAAVLRLREIHEQREERLLSQILVQIAQAREAILAIDVEMVASAATREAQLLGRMSAAELHGAYGLAAMLKERRHFHEQQLGRFEALQEKQIKIYRAAHQDRELLSSMREEQQEAYLAEQGRQQQKSLDDLFIARRMHR